MKIINHTFALLFFTSYVIGQSSSAKFESIPEELREKIIAEIPNSSSKISDNGKEIKNKSSLVSINTNSKKIINNDKIPIERFGDSFFLNAPSTFMPINDPSQNSGYVLDVDDLLKIQLIGDRSDQYEYRIDSSGNIILADIGPVNVAGITIKAANDLINEKLKSTFVETNAVLTLSEVRDISVLVTGYVKNPGYYVLNGYSNVMHAILMSGGISDNGTFREVILRRAGRDPISIDLYDILLFANPSSNHSLRSGDALFINSSHNYVPIIGGVARPALYEFKENETLGDLLKFAGGVTNDASKTSIVLSRTINGTLTKLDPDFEAKLKKKDKIFVPYNEYDESSLLIGEAEEFLGKPITVTGAVNRPGTYYLKQDEKLSSLIRKFGGYKNEAYIYGSILINNEAKIKELEFNRRLYNEAIKSISSLSLASSKNINISSLMPLLEEFKNLTTAGRIVAEFDPDKLRSNPSDDIILSPGDNIHIPYKKNIIYIFGEVLNTGSISYDKSFSAKDYIRASGGLNKTADKYSIFVVHANGKAEKLKYRTNIFGSRNPEINPGDVIFVSRDLESLAGVELASKIAPIISSMAISIASIKSISN
jgi:protein involved in polysaccharide export with SLBB domain